MKLNEKNYLLWSKSFTMFLGAHRKIKHITQNLSSTKNLTYDDRFTTDCGVISRFVNIMEENITVALMFLNPVKKIH